MLKETFMRELGTMIKLMVMESTLIMVGVVTKDNGSVINNMVMGMKNGQMVQNTQANIIKVSNMEKVNSYGLINASMKESSKIIISMVAAYTNGTMTESLKETGKITRWKAKESLHGLMVVNTLVIILMIKNMELVLSNGLMVEHTMATG